MLEREQGGALHDLQPVSHHGQRTDLSGLGTIVGGDRTFCNAEIFLPPFNHDVGVKNKIIGAPIQIDFFEGINPIRAEARMILTQMHAEGGVGISGEKFVSYKLPDGHSSP